MRRPFVLTPAATVIAVALAALCIAAVTLKPYGGNPTALFHLDDAMATAHPVPAGFVVLQMPGYDGMQYYQIARSLPQIADRSQWPTLGADTLPGSYAYQRFLLPLVAGTVSLGDADALPWVFLAINLLSIIAVVALCMRALPHAPLAALTLGLGPAALIGLHFSLAEPLTLLVLTAALLRMRSVGRLDWAGALLLALGMLAREINILLLVGIIGWLLLQRRWKELPWTLLPLLAWVGLHSLIYGIFGQIPFLMSAAKHTVPFGAIAELLTGKLGQGIPALSSAVLLLGFVVPATVLIGRHVWATRKAPDMEAVALLGFLCVMLLMPSFIWAAITSIGRVITPVYPLWAIHAATHPSHKTQSLSIALIVIGLVTALGLASTIHPFVLAP